MENRSLYKKENNSALATLTGSDVLKARHDLFNGNISSMATTITAPSTIPRKMQKMLTKIGKLQFF